MYNTGDVVLYKSIKAKIRQILGNDIYLVEFIVDGVLYVQIAKDVELELFTNKEDFERGM